MSLDSQSTNSIARRVATSAILATLALIFSYVEAILPFNIGIPGIKLGLANLVVVITLYELDARYALAVNLVRVMIAGLLFSGLYGMLFSLAGCIASYLVMLLLHRTGRFSIIGVSMGGGVAHTMGQLLVAILMVSNLRLSYYLPILLFSGMICGIIVGIGSHVLIARIPRLLFTRQ